MSNPQVHDSQKSVPSTQPKTFKQDSVSCLSEDENTNARLSTSLAGGAGNHADEDWSQAEIELMELLDGK